MPKHTYLWTLYPILNHQVNHQWEIAVRSIDTDSRFSLARSAISDSLVARAQDTSSPGYCQCTDDVFPGDNLVSRVSLTSFLVSGFIDIHYIDRSLDVTRCYHCFTQQEPTQQCIIIALIHIFMSMKDGQFFSSQRVNIIGYRYLPFDNVF
jgi:hypothetical protein